MQSLNEPAFNIQLKSPILQGSTMLQDFQGDTFVYTDSRGWTYRLEYTHAIEVNEQTSYMYQKFLVIKRLTKREGLFERLDYCLHAHWQLAADPRFNYRGAVAMMSKANVDRLMNLAELAYALMTRHAGRESLIINAYNKLVEQMGWIMGAIFTMCKVSGTLLAEIMN